MRAGLEALGHQAQAAASTHFAYEMVSLSAGTARQLGFLGESDSAEGAGLEMSGRKGIGVKADDLLDMLESKSRDEISQRNRDLSETELADLSSQIATAALRFFMAKATTTRVIAFDLEEALSFEGETGPYLQYVHASAASILRKGGDKGDADPALLADEREWDLLRRLAEFPAAAARAAEDCEPSILSSYLYDLAREFRGYHAAGGRDPALRVLTGDPALQASRLQLVGGVKRTLGVGLRLLGIEPLEEM